MLGLCFSAGVNRKGGKKEQREKLKNLSTLCFYFCPNNNKKREKILFLFIFFYESFVLYDSVFFSIHWLLTGIQRPTTLSFSTHTFC